MGNSFNINMEENFRKNQDFITEMNTIKVLVIYIHIHQEKNKYFNFRLKDKYKWEIKWERGW